MAVSSAGVSSSQELRDRQSGLRGSVRSSHGSEDADSDEVGVNFRRILKKPNSQSDENVLATPLGDLRRATDALIIEVGDSSVVNIHRSDQRPESTGRTRPVLRRSPALSAGRSQARRHLRRAYQLGLR